MELLQPWVNSAFLSRVIARGTGTFITKHLTQFSSKTPGLENRIPAVASSYPAIIPFTSGIYDRVDETQLYPFSCEPSAQ